MNKNIKRLLFGLGIALIAIIIWQYPKLNLISGFAAKNTASTMFLTGRTLESIETSDHNVPLVRLAKSAYDSAKKRASASVYGLMEREAICRDGLGCILLTGDADTIAYNVQPKRSLSTSALPYPFGDARETDTLFETVDYQKMALALDHVFHDTVKTRTVLVLYKDHIVAERYSEGFDKSTPVLGWSMTKSVLATLYGILQYQGKLNVNETVSLPSWKDDERKNITLDHLLRMQSGLAWEEDYSTISDVTKMLFLESNMAESQTKKNMLAPPTAIWNYSSGTSNLLSGLLRTKFDSYQEYLNFPYKALIDKIGMNSMFLETDLAGNFVGSSYGWATTRDWGKFGLLYLHQGNWNGEQLFDTSWATYITTPTKHSDGVYGAHFWLNAEGKFPDVPRDLYSANGYQGQHVFIIPSKELVVVRTGLAEEPQFNTNTFLKELLSAIQ